MKVELVAYTNIDYAGLSQMGYKPHPISSDQPDWGVSDELAEAAGRLCYLSWNRPNPATSTNRGYLNNIINQRHFSVLEHASASFYIEGVSRTLTHELIRHRHLSFSELSQRYVDVSGFPVVVPPVLKSVLNDELADDPPAEYGWTIGDEIYANHEANKDGYERIIRKLESFGLDRKTARGAARAILPAGLETKILVTGNHRAWRDVIEKRNSPAADLEIRFLAKELLRQLKVLSPSTYQDMEV